MRTPRSIATASPAACAISPMHRAWNGACCRRVPRGSSATSSKPIRARAASPTPSISAVAPRVAWKTGTSYGFRDAWALGGTRRYSVGVWVGRPDGTPLPGQYGAVTALPLLFEVIDSLPRTRGDGAPRPPPSNVRRDRRVLAAGPAAGSAGAAAVPQEARRPGRSMARCRRPSPNAMRACGAPAVSASTSTHAAACACPPIAYSAARTPHQRARALARAGFAVVVRGNARTAARLPALSPDCAPDGRDATEELRIEGINRPRHAGACAQQRDALATFDCARSAAKRGSAGCSTAA